MKNILRFFLVAAVAVACSTVKVSYDYDKTADFAKYKTYAYSDDALKLNVGQLNRDRVLAAVDREMAARGFSKSDAPDALVDLHMRTEEKREATATTSGTGMYPWRYGYGGGFTTTQINVNEYTEGTLFVNLVDKATEKIVWQGRGTKTLDMDASPEKREANINSGIAAIFKKYPIQPK